MSVFTIRTSYLRKKDDITDLKERLVTEVTVDNGKYFFTCLYRSPSQNCDQCSDFCKDFSILLNINDHRPSCSLIAMLNTQNGTRLIKIMQLEKLCRLRQQLQVTVS